MDFWRVIGELRNAGKRLGEGQRERQAQFRSALAALSLALNETRICLGKREITDEDEKRLSRLWASAGVTISRFDHDLALRCDIKASYWANPERWTDEQLDAAKIEIGQMEEEIRRLFGGR